MKVLVSDGLSNNGIEILKNAGIEVINKKLGLQDLLKEINEYDGLIVRSGTTVTSEIIEKADRLKIIGRAGSGLDNVDLPAATKKGIVVMNTPGGNTVTTAEHSISLLVSMARMIPQATASTKSGKWEKNKFMGIELYNKVLGVIGFGQIGSYVAKLAQGLMMQVIAYDPFLSPEKAQKVGVQIGDLSEIFRRSDFITIHSPLTAETKNLINKETIKEMKDGVCIINCARGGIVNENDLYEALVSGKIKSAALDVFEKEPADPNNPLLSLGNVICTPHLGAATAEAQENVSVAIAEQIVDYLTKGIIRNAANLPSVSTDILSKVQPYIALAEKLGKFQSQLYGGALKKVTIEYRGEISSLPTDPITIAALKGLLSPILNETVNYVNATIIAKERGVEVEEMKVVESGSNFSSLIVLRIKSGEHESKIIGTLYTKMDPRIVEIDDFSVEVIPDGNMLVLFNNDKPGLIGNMGTFLGKNNINISRMHFGRETPGGKAIAIIGVDSQINPDLLSQIKELPNVLSVKQIAL